MSGYSDFPLAIKSTLDFYANQLAQSLSLPFIDLGADSFDSEITESDQPAICWEFSIVDESPRDPLWQVNFDIGAMTFQDPAQYISLGIVGKLSETFRVGNRFMIKDYHGVSAPVDGLGILTVTNVMGTPQHSDKLVGFRFVSVSAKAVRFIND